MTTTKRKSQTPVRSTRLVRLPGKVQAYLALYQEYAAKKADAMRRMDFAAAAAYIAERQHAADVVCQELLMQPNDRCERWGPAATDARIVADLNGWSPSAPHLGVRLTWA
jgi:hypothetical protein